jgi:hypothetical protein
MKNPLYDNVLEQLVLLLMYLTTQDESIQFELFETMINGEIFYAIRSIIFNRINNFKKVGEFKSMGNIVIAGMDFVQIDLSRGIYSVYNVDGCLLIINDLITITKNAVLNEVFKFYGSKIDVENLFGFFDGSALDDFSMRSLPPSGFGEAQAVRITDDKIIGYAMDCQCGSLFSLPCIMHDKCALLVGGNVMSKIFI